MEDWGMGTKSSHRKAFLFLVLATLFVASLACSPGGGGGTSEPGATEAPSSGGAVSPGGAVSSLDDVKSATIQIEAEGSFVDPQVGSVFNSAGRGSGFIIDPSGIAVTNNHVVAGAALIKVWVGGESKELSAKVLGVSECSDLAVIDIEGSGYPYLEWSKDPIKVGEDIYAAGFPLGDPEFTLTRGVISKEEANGETSWASVTSSIEFDATINPGNSGGPVVTEDGKVVAVAYASNASARQSFGISGELAQQVTDELATGKDLDSIGINGQAVSNDDGSLVGVWVSAVTSGSPADKAGVEAGDIITMLENLVLATDGTMSDYCDIIRGHDVTDTMAIEVLRFSTSEVLGGQLNGDELTTAFAFEGQGGETTGDGSTGTAGTYGTYTLVTDNYGAIQIEVPSAWSDVDGSEWIDSGDVIGAKILASSDLNAFSNSWGVPGVVFMVSDDLARLGGYVQLLDWERESFLQSCELDGRYDYEDSVFRGKYDLFTKCGGAGGPEELVLTAVPKANSTDYLIVVAVTVASDADLDALEHILTTFDVVGSLP
jgi:serine protease Do